MAWKRIKFEDRLVFYRDRLQKTRKLYKRAMKILRNQKLSSRNEQEKLFKMSVSLKLIKKQRRVKKLLSQKNSRGCIKSI